MDKHAHSPAGHPASHPGYEVTDVHPSSLAKTAAMLGGLVFFSIVAMVVLYKVFDYYQPRADKPRHPLADSRYVSSAPKLQPDPPALKEELRTVENQVLTTYDWTDKEKGLVRIPIERAIELVAQQQKLPVLKATEAALPSKP
ncbi:MAG: hypothetical protein HYW07_12735 [Candidatus Latescibacteria bacterium]|nr:hypothetical protein [Candidatus Latescibacterota bacterium]